MNNDHFHTTYETDGFDGFTPVSHSTIPGQFPNTYPVPAPPKKSRTKFYLAMAPLVAVIVAGIGLGFMGLTNTGSKTVTNAANKVLSDSGVEACKQMAVNASTSSDDSSNAPITEAQRDEKLKPFQNSRYNDIKAAGTLLINDLYKMDQMSQQDSDDDSDLGAAFGMLGTITADYGALRTACAAHGVQLPMLGS